MPRISQAQRDARRDRILAAALRCFSRDGFHATTTADIVRESGISQGALYLYFSTKDDIVVALASDRHEGEAFLSAMAERERDPVKGLRLLVELHGRSLGERHRSDVRRVGVQGWGEALRNPTIRASVTDGLSSVRKAIVGLVRRGQRSGQMLASLDPDAVARILIATFQGLVLQVTWDEPVDVAHCGQVMRTMIRDALLTPVGRASWERVIESRRSAAQQYERQRT